MAEVPFDEYDDYDDFGQYPQIRTKPNKPVEEPKPQGKTKVETRTPDRNLGFVRLHLVSFLPGSCKSSPKITCPSHSERHMAQEDHDRNNA